MNYSLGISDFSLTGISDEFLWATIGRFLLTLQRHVRWFRNRSEFATHRTSDVLPHEIESHQSLLLRPLKDIEMWLQYNKIANLRLAIECLDGLLVESGQVFSVWYLVGSPSRRRGFHVGMTLQNGYDSYPKPAG